MGPPDTRGAQWRALAEPVDVLVIGGGIVGAGIARAAARRGHGVALVEQADFASGTSSRTSKFVHGGLRYLAHGAVPITFRSVRAREQLLRHGSGLIEPIDFLLAHYSGASPGLGMTGAVLTVYDAMSTRQTHRRHRRDDVLRLVPGLNEARLTDCYSYLDAQTDDARLTLRVLSEARLAGARALNYVRVTRLVRVRDRVVGAELADQIDGSTVEVRAKLVVNATGPWADQFAGPETRPLRPLRGSHLIFPGDRLALDRAVTIPHPQDGRAICFSPWENATIVGTTDVDHTAGLDDEPVISSAELDYLLASARQGFPTASLDADDVISCHAGVRPVIDTGKSDPSAESREHAMHYRDGLLTVVGGKLTTYHVMARAALAAVPRDVLPERGRRSTPPLDSLVGLAALAGVSDSVGGRLTGRYGAAVEELVASARPGELVQLPGVPVSPAELRWAARHEAVEHLDDLLLRRVRLGLLAPRGGEEHLAVIEPICRDELSWDDARWTTELARYRQLWRRSYSVAGAG